ncbi:MAG TPA: LuxR family transcriptional regulator [Solirubrobacteraceae bacterium]|nr:LuxR family transcriptional regulator [Solirubrobacteraceae bacterium]
MADDDLHERNEALGAISEALAAAHGGAGAVVFLQGEAGVGKTALLRRASELAGAETRLVQARGAVMERDLPFAFVDQLAAAGLLADREMLDDPAARRAAVYAAARAQMRSWAAAGPTVALLDDLQWADLDSLAVVGFLARRLARLPIAMIGALRPWPAPAGALARALAHEDVARIVALAPLSEDAAGHVLMDRLGDPLAGRFTHDAWRLTGGNPLLLVEAARTLRLTGSLPVPGEGGGGERMRQLLLLSHMGGVGKAASACAQAAAVLGAPARSTAVRAVSGLSQKEFAAALDTLVAAGVLRADGSSLEFTHDLMASAVYHDIGPTHRALMHGRAFANQLEHGDASAAAPHAIAAGLDDESAIAVIADAAELALLAGALETGLRQLEAAVALAGPMPSDALLHRYADALFASGRAGEALDAYRRLLARPLDAPERRSVLMRAGRAQAYAGRLRDSLETYDDLVAAAGGPSAAPTAIVLERSHVVWELDGPVAALAALGDRDGDADEMHAIARAGFALEAGDPSGIPAVARAARSARASLVARPGDTADSFNAFLIHVGACGMTERYDEAEEYIEHGTAWLRSAGVAWATVPLRICRIGILCHQGALLEAITETEDIDEELQVSPLLLPYLLVLRARALVWLGRLDEAAALCDRVDGLPGARSWFVRLYLTMNRAEHRWAEGRVDEAARLYRDGAHLADRLGVREPCLVPWAAGAVEAALAANEYDEAAAIVEWLRGCVEWLPCIWPRMVMLAGVAGCAAAAGDAAGAEAHYQQALALPVIAPLDRARVLLRYGAWLRRSNHARRARTPLAQALHVADAHGAAPLAALASAELSAAGGRRRRPREDDGLTPQEARVAAIAVTGATMREIAVALHLSPRTVETHLSRVYLKLGVGSKQELRRRQAELGPALAPPAPRAAASGVGPDPASAPNGAGADTAGVPRGRT